MTNDLIVTYVVKQLLIYMLILVLYLAFTSVKHYHLMSTIWFSGNHVINVKSASTTFHCRFYIINDFLFFQLFEDG